MLQWKITYSLNKKKLVYKTSQVILSSYLVEKRKEICKIIEYVIHIWKLFSQALGWEFDGREVLDPQEKINSFHIPSYILTESEKFRRK